MIVAVVELTNVLEAFFNRAEVFWMEGLPLTSVRASV